MTFNKRKHDQNRLAEFRRLAAGAVPRWGRFYQLQIEAYEQELGLESRPEFKSKTEMAWAEVFDRLAISWRYEAIEPELARALRYRPDFWLPDVGQFCEIKGKLPTEGELRVCRQLHQATGDRVVLLSGWPRWGKFSAWIFDQAGEVVTRRADMSALVVAQWGDCGFNEVKLAFSEVK